MKKSSIIVFILLLAGLIVWGVNEGYIKFRSKTERQIFKTYQKSVNKAKSVFGN